MFPVVVAGYHDDLAVGGFEEDLLEQCEALAGTIGIRRQPQVEGNNRQLFLPHLAKCRIPLTGDHYLVVLEAPAQLGLQPGVVFNNQQFPCSCFHYHQYLVFPTSTLRYFHPHR